MEEITVNSVLGLVLSAAIGAVVATAIGLFFKFIEKIFTKKSGLNQAVMVLLEDRINYVGGCYIKQGWVYADDKDRLNRMWTVYHNKLGGNGFLNELMHSVNQLEVKYRK